MNLKLLIIPVGIFALFLATFTWVVCRSTDTLEKRYHNLMNTEFSTSRYLSEEKMLEARPEIKNIKILLDRLSKLEFQVRDLSRSPAPMYHEDREQERIRCRQDAQRLKRKIVKLLESQEIRLALTSDSIADR